MLKNDPDFNKVVAIRAKKRMDVQWLLNSLTGICGVLFGFLIKNLWEEHKDLREKHHMIQKEVSEVRIVIADVYLKKTDFDKSVDLIYTKLDKIDQKLSA